MKRIKRRQLKEDELVSTFTKLTRFGKKHSREIYFLGIVLLIALLIYVGYSVYKNQRNKRNSVLISKILQLNSEIRSNPEKIRELENYESQKGFGRTAIIFLASYYIERGELLKAEKELEKIPEKPKDFLYYKSQCLKSDIHFLKGEYDKALSILLKIEEEKPNDFVLDFVFYKIAQCYERIGKKNEALIYYQKIQDEYPQSYYALDASQRIKFLK